MTAVYKQHGITLTWYRQSQSNLIDLLLLQLHCHVYYLQVLRKEFNSLTIVISKDDRFSKKFEPSNFLRKYLLQRGNTWNLAAGDRRYQHENCTVSNKDCIWMNPFLFVWIMLVLPLRFLIFLIYLLTNFLFTKN